MSTPTVNFTWVITALVAANYGTDDVGTSTFTITADIGSWGCLVSG
jgi:hypothetical protein